MPKYRGKECTPICNIKDGQGNDFPRDPDDPTQVLVNTVYLDDFDPADGDKGSLVNGCLPIPTNRCPVNLAGLQYPKDDAGNPIIDIIWVNGYSPAAGSKGVRNADGCLQMPTPNLPENLAGVPYPTDPDGNSIIDIQYVAASDFTGSAGDKGIRNADGCILSPLAPPLVDLEGAPIPQTAAGAWIVHNLASVETVAPCPIGDMEPVYCVGAALYTRPSYSKQQLVFNDNPDTTPGGQWAPGDYKELCLTVVNDDPCGRTMQCKFALNWAGFNAAINSGAFAIGYMSDAGNGGGYVPFSGTYLDNPGIYNVAGPSQDIDITIAPGASHTVKLKYQVFAADDAVTQSDVSAFSTNLCVVCRAV